MADALHLVLMVRKPTKHALHAAIGARIQTCRPDGKHSAANTAERTPSSVLLVWADKAILVPGANILPIHYQYIANKGQHSCMPNIS